MSRTSKMSGQRGVDQHPAKGFDTGAHRSTFAGSHVGHEALPLSDLDWDELQDLYPSLIPDGSIGAIPRPAWRELDSGAAPKGTPRGIARYEARLVDALLTDSDVEKLGFTAPEIEELLGGTHVPGHTEGENLVMSDMARASKRVIALAEEGPQQLGLDLSDEIQVFMGAHLGIFTLANRGNQRERYSGPQVVLGPGRRFVSLDARLIPTAFEQGLQRINQIEDPVARGATWAAFLTYHQPYFDGNKRLGRYSMNAYLLSRGYDAIVVPRRLKDDYVDAVVDAYETGDLTGHIEFLLDQYHD